MNIKKGNLAGVAILLFLFGWILGVKVQSKKTQIITIPSKTGSKIEIVEKIVRDTVYLPGKVETKVEKFIVVDSTYKSLYDIAIKNNDSLTARSLYLESIQINNYSKVLVDNQDVKISGDITTRGFLLDYKINYMVKSKEVKVERIESFPRLSLIAGIELGVPLDPELPNSIGLNLGFMKKNGSAWTLGFDTDSRVSVGYCKVFKAF